MKSFIQTLKLTEPITPSEKSKPINNRSQSNSNHTNASEEKNAFKSMLNKQVRDRQLENQRTQQKQAENKAEAKNSQQAVSDTPVAKMEVDQANATDALVSTEVPQVSLNIAGNAKPVENLKAAQLDGAVINDSGEIRKGKILKELATNVTNHEPVVTSSQPIVKNEADLATQQTLAAIAQQAKLAGQNLPTQDVEVSSTIDDMLNQKIAADLRKKSMDKVELSRDWNNHVDQDMVVEEDLTISKNNEFSEQLMTEKGLGKGQQFAQAYHQQVTQTQAKPRDSSAESNKFDLAHVKLDSQVTAQNTANGQIAAQGVTNSANMSNNAQPVAASNQIYTPFNNRAGWSQAINQRVMYMIGANEQSATLTLNPPDLGPLQVVINVNNEKADTTFFSDNANVRQALEDGMADLRDKMNQAGISLGQADVNTGQQFQQPHTKEHASQTAFSRTNSSVETGEVEQRTVIVREQNGLVDTFA